MMSVIEVALGGDSVGLNGESSGIEKLIADKGRADVYDLSGRPIMLNADAIERQQLKRGVYIVKDSRSARKIIIK